MNSHQIIAKRIRKILLEESNQVAVDFQLLPVETKDIDQIVSVCDSAFNHTFFKCSTTNNKERILQMMDMTLSVKLVIDGNIEGFYLFSTKETIDDFIKMAQNHGVKMTIDNQTLYDELKNKKGIQGLTVGISQKYKKQGFGRKLLEYPSKLGVDYVWGVQTGGVSNIDKWRERRQVLASAHGYWITVQVF